jgi:hypothetical protein
MGSDLFIGEERQNVESTGYIERSKKFISINFVVSGRD